MLVNLPRAPALCFARLYFDPFSTCQIHSRRDEKTEADECRDTGKHSRELEIPMGIAENSTANWGSGQCCPATQEKDGALSNADFSYG